MTYPPKDIHLKYPPLAEAWLELNWKLQDIEQNLRRDPGYPIALGMFYNLVRDKYPLQHQLPINDIPSELVPQMVRFQFRKADNGYPLLQIGPGIASVNFTSEGYHWTAFRTEAEYLIDSIVKAYEPTEFPLRLESTALRYRNIFPLDEVNDPLQFTSLLNTKIDIPIINHSSPIHFDLNFNYALEVPQGSTGVIKLATANRLQEGDDFGPQLLVLDLAIIATERSKINLDNQLLNWLDISHEFIHNWFFEFIQGELFERLKG